MVSRVALTALFLAGLCAAGLAQEAASPNLPDATHDALEAVKPAAGTAALPNGASSITENFQDWTLNCAVENAQKFCTISQAQGNSQTGQQVFAIELRAPVEGTSEGVIVLPFGLDIRQAVTLKIDEQTLGQGAHVTTCVPAGCIVPVTLPEAAINGLKAGTALKVTATTFDPNNKTAEFSVSLKGFTAAHNRVSELSK